MRFNRFTITNYKGIDQCTVDLAGVVPRVLALIGLNESGKTTILEAINHFVAGDRGLQKVYGIETLSIDKSSFVPKHKQLNFNDDISIAASVTIEKDDFVALDLAFKEVGYTLVEVPTTQDITVVQRFTFENSKYKSSGRTWTMALKARKINGTKVLRVDPDHPCWNAYWSTTEKRLPRICYFPTLLFDIPDKILIEPHTDESASNAYYRQLIQDILDSLNQDLSVQTHIIDRIRGADGQKTWDQFLLGDERGQVNHLVSSAGAQMTKVIIESWKRVFKGSFENKRVEIEYEIDAETSLIGLRIFISDFPERYAIQERSLGFQWFFCFWLFTYFRTLRSDKAGVVFLLDEPASNLHAGAQKEILESLSHLATGNNSVLYSTHSHYLINPTLLEGAVVVSNGTGDDGAIEHEFGSKKSISISAVPYKQFAFRHKNQRTYFTPVLDALEYRPSELTINQPSLIVEGKADYAFLSAVLPSDRGYAIIPAGGAMSMLPLISLLTGWGFKFACLLDDDKEGKDALKKYLHTGLIDQNNSATLVKFLSQAKNKSLEKIVSEELHRQIADHFSVDVIDKAMVQAFIYEKYSAGGGIILTDIMAEMSRNIHEWAKSYLTV